MRRREIRVKSYSRSLSVHLAVRLDTDGRGAKRTASGVRTAVASAVSDARRESETQWFQNHSFRCEGVGSSIWTRTTTG